MHALSLLPSFPVASRSALGEAVRGFGFESFPALAAHVAGLPYGRVADPVDAVSVLREGRGTCSSKHRLLAAVAQDAGHPEIELIVGLYAMSEANTPGVGAVLGATPGGWIPEAHTWLRVAGARVDLTGLPAGAESPFDALIEEHVVPPAALVETKTRLHREVLAQWAPTVGLSAAEAWTLREACIAALVLGAAADQAPGQPGITAATWRAG